jgi:molecular chaperone GrpE
MPSSPASDGSGRAVEEAGAETPADVRSEAGGDPPRDLESELEQSEDRYKRALADLDNYRKRSAREIDRRVSERSEQITRDWLEAVDSVERALRMQAPTNELAAGLRAVLEQMEVILERQGVERIGAAGEPFDPELHDAIGIHETDQAPDRTIFEVARSGYSLGDRVLRPAQVIVARNTGDGSHGEAGED